MDFTSKIIVITGATSGIGASFATAFARLGSALILSGRREKMLRERRATLLSLGAQSVELVLGDLQDSNVSETLVQTVAGRSPSVLINNVGFGYHADVAHARTERLEAMVKIQAQLPTTLSRLALAGMTERGEGLLINVGSLAGRAAVPGAAVYVATKVYLERLSETMALEAAPHGVVVQALTPGYVRTDFHREFEDYRNRRKNRGLIRWMDAEEVVEKSMAVAARAERRLRRGRTTVPRRADVVVIPGMTNRLLAALAPFVPRTLVYRAASSRTQM